MTSASSALNHNGLIVRMKRITRIEPQLHDKNRVSLDLDGEFAFGLTRRAAEGLSVGQELSDAEITAIQETESEEKAYLKALDYLARRDYAEAELRKKLKLKGFSAAQVQKAIARIRGLGYINDRCFAENWIRDRSEFNPRSARMLRYELKLKGVQDTVIEESLAAVDDERAAFASAERYARRLTGLDWITFRNRLGGYLARRGFSYDVIRKTVRAAWDASHGSDEAETYDEMEL